MHLIDNGDRAGHRLEQSTGQLEADIERLGADVEQQITRSGRGVVAGTAQFRERVQFGRPRPGEQPIPGVGSDRGHQGQVLGRIAETNRAHQA